MLAPSMRESWPSVLLKKHNLVLARYTFTPDGGAINVAKHGNKRESLPLEIVVKT